MVVRTEALAPGPESELFGLSGVSAMAPPVSEFHPNQDLPVFNAIAGVRNRDIFPDGKTLADSCPIDSIAAISGRFVVESTEPSFNLPKFWSENFVVPDYRLRTGSSGDKTGGVDGYITSMWGNLTRHDTHNRGPIIGTPNPHLIPGERFSEGYYWDLADGVGGLLAEARTDGPLDSNNKENLALGVAANLAYQIDQYGYVPNGLRTYYLGRSQPPVFAGIVKEMAAHFGERKPNLVEEYLPAITAEYEWWMKGEESLEGRSAPSTQDRVVQLPDGAILNRHWDANNTPRPESYDEDIRTAKLADGIDHREVFRHLRAAAETGRDFTARFMADPERLETIHTTDFLTPELNSMLWEYETMIATAHDKAGRSVKAAEFHDRADRRQAAMNTYLWNEDDGCYYDYDYTRGVQSKIKSMATAYPVSRGVASFEQASKVSSVLGKDLLKRGGFVSTAIESDQQWDSPNGFARDQIEGVNALLAVGSPIAAVAIERWLKSDDEIFNQYGVLVEKTNVVAPVAEIGRGGEYSPQEGFLWTNGVHRLMQERQRALQTFSYVSEQLAA